MSKATSMPAFGVQKRLMSRGRFDDEGYLTGHPGDPVWNVLRVHGPVDRDCLTEAVALVTERIDTLQLRLRETADGSRMEWRDAEPVRVQIIEVGRLFTDGRLDPAVAGPLIPVVLGRPENLRHDPLARCTLVSASEWEHLLVLSVDHLAADGWSMGLLLRRLVRCYQALLRGERAAAVRRADGPTFRDHVMALPSAEIQDGALADWADRLTEYPLPGPTFRPPGGAPKDPADCHLDATSEFDVSDAALVDLAALADQLGVTRPQALGAVTCALATMWSDGPQPVFQFRHGRQRRADIPIVGPMIEVCLGLPPADDLTMPQWLARYVASNPVRPLYGRSLWETGRFGPRYVGFNVVPPARTMVLAPGTTADPLGGDQLAPLWPEDDGGVKSFAAVWIHYYLDDNLSLRMLVQHDSDVLPDASVLIGGLRTVLAAGITPVGVPMSQLRASAR